MTRMVTVPEAVQALGVSSTTLIRYIKKGTISGEKSGGIYLIPASEIPRMKKQLEKDPREVKRQKTWSLGIPRLYRLCSQGKFAEVAKELAVDTIPRDYHECLILVNQKRWNK